MRGSRASIVVGVLATVAPARAADLLLQPQTSRCEQIEFEAEAATCDAATCVLTGHAYLRCDALRVWAHELEVRFTEDRQFAGAEARGGATVADGRTLVTCERVVLAPDRVQGRIEEATIRIKAGRGTDREGRPTGRDTSVLHGDITRHDQDTLTVRDGDFTLCDCQGDEPSWKIGASEIDVELHERATLWWPIFYINPFGLGLIPITPPGPPLSIPLKPRAWGLLPPAVAFYGPFPMIDLPFFIPLGESWDLTPSIGLRTDWVRNRDFRPSRWGAPRAGLRLRYAPSEAVRGELRVQWTWDQRLFVAREYFRQQDRSTLIAVAQGRVASATTPEQRAAAQTDLARLVAQQASVMEEVARLLELQHRVTVDFEQTVAPIEGLRWTTHAQWLSDDLVLRDFAVSLDERVAAYVPSRSLLTFDSRDWPIGLMTSLGADYLLALGNDPESHSNVQDGDLDTFHRGPALRASLLPFAVWPEGLPGVHVEAEVTAARFGPWDPERPAGLAVGTAWVGTRYLDAWGPVRFDAFVRGHGQLAEDARLGDAAQLFLHLGANVRTEWAGEWGALLHTLAPVLRYRAIPARRRSDPPVSHALRVSAEERLDVHEFHQVAAALEQGWWLKGARAVGLHVEAPFSLDRLEALPVRGELDWSAPYVGRGRTWMAVDPRPTPNPVQEIGVDLAVPIGPVEVRAAYLRFGPGADRFGRSLYALADDLVRPALPEQWVHALSPTLSLRTELVQASYGIVALLPQPGDPTTDPPRPLISMHQGRFSYVSPCECWEIGASAVVPGYGTPAEVLAGLRVQVNLSIGGYALGNVR